jgi:hypothetical protein
MNSHVLSWFKTVDSKAWQFVCIHICLICEYAALYIPKYCASRVTPFLHAYKVFRRLQRRVLRYPLSFYVLRHFMLLQCVCLFICRSKAKSIEGKFGYKNSDARAGVEIIFA